MKSFTIFINALLILLIFSSFRVFPQWQEQTSPTTSPLYTVSVVDNSVAWIGGQIGTVLKTTDGGSTWSSVGGASIGNNVYAIFGVDGQTALCAAKNISPFDYMYVYKTTDGGTTWTLVYTRIGGTINGIWMYSTLNGIMCGSPVNSLWEFYNTTDGGNTWNETSNLFENGTEFGYHNSVFVSGSDIYFGTTNSTIYHSNDMGNNWIPQTTTQASSYSIWFNSASNGLMGGATELNQTTNGGNTWSLLSNLPGTGSINAITGLNDQWWTARQNMIYYSDDDAVSWISQYTSPTSGTYNAISKSRNGNLIIAVRSDGGISAYTLTVPVELVSFTAHLNNNFAELNWKTAIENNNKGFEIERKVNGSHSSVLSNWEKIGFVEGNGTATDEHFYSFSDNILNLNSTKVLYRIKQIDFNGSYSYSDEVEVSLIPDKFDLSQNYPNPFNPSTKIKFTLPFSANILLEIYNCLGEKISVLANEDFNAGYHEVIFNAENLPDDKAGLSSGVYLYRIQANSNEGNSRFIETKKMILTK